MILSNKKKPLQIWSGFIKLNHEIISIQDFELLVC